MSTNEVKASTISYQPVYQIREKDLERLKYNKKEFRKMNSLEFAWNTSIQPVLKSTAVGAVGGAVIGGVVGGVALPGVGVVPGALTGGLVGGTGGFIWGLVSVGVEMAEYDAWAEKIHSKISIKEISELFRETETDVFRALECPVNMTLMTNPVRHKSNPKIVWDLSAVKKMVEKNADETGRYYDHLNNQWIGLDDFEPDYHSVAKIQAAFKNQLEKDLEGQRDDKIKNGMKEAIKLYDSQLNQFYERQSTKLTKQLRDGKITRQQHAQIMNELNASLNG